MQLALLDIDEGEVSIDYGYGHVECLREQSELARHVDDPLDEEASRGVLDLGLHLLEVLVVDEELLLHLEHRVVHILCHLSYILRVPHIQLVAQGQLLLTQLL